MACPICSCDSVSVKETIRGVYQSRTYYVMVCDNCGCEFEYDR